MVDRNEVIKPNAEQQVRLREALKWLTVHRDRIDATNFNMEEYGFTGGESNEFGERKHAAYIHECSTPSCLLGWMTTSLREDDIDQSLREGKGRLPLKVSFMDVSIHTFGVVGARRVWDYLFGVDWALDPDTNTIDAAIERLSLYLANDFEITDEMRAELERVESL